MASETVLPHLAGVAKSKKARSGFVNPRPHTTAPKSGVGTLEPRQPQSANSRSSPATIPLAPTALGKSHEKTSHSICTITGGGNEQNQENKEASYQGDDARPKGHRCYSCMFGGSAATAEARANPNIKMTVRGRMNAGINCETLS
jgi:hypothetical protein